MKTEKYTILIVEDDNKIRQMVSLFLKGNGFVIIEAEDGVKGLEILSSHEDDIDLILLDVMMPYLDGFSVLKKIREDSMIPVIMLTARDEEYDQLKGLKNGADDYISKPFSPTVLLARIETILRRINKKDKPEKIICGNIIIDDLAKTVYHDETPLVLTQKEYELIVYFLMNNGIVLTREQILNAIWNYDYDGDPRTVDTHIKQIRAKLGEDGKKIKTIHKIGYMFASAK